MIKTFCVIFIGILGVALNTYFFSESHIFSYMFGLIIGCLATNILYLKDSI